MNYVSPYLLLPLRTRAQADNGKRHIATLTSALLTSVWVEYAPRRDNDFPLALTDLAVQLLAIEAFV